MSMTKREKVLAAATVFVVAFGLALTQARSRLEAIRTKSGAAGELAAKIQMQRELIGAAADWAQALGRSLASGQVMNTTTAAAGKEARVSFSCVI